MGERDDLPLPDYDHLPLGSLTTRIRSLDVGDLQTLVQYEATSGPPVNPPSQGDPTNPAQPR
jgi:hypothetical protein